MPDVAVLRLVRMCSFLNSACVLWEECTHRAPCMRHLSRRTACSRLLSDLMCGIRSSIDRTGRLRSTTRLKRALIHSTFDGWVVSDDRPVPQEMGCSVEGKTALLLMITERVFYWAGAALRGIVRHDSVLAFRRFLGAARPCFALQPFRSACLQFPEDLDWLLGRYLLEGPMQGAHRRPCDRNIRRRGRGANAAP